MPGTPVTTPWPSRGKPAPWHRRPFASPRRHHSTVPRRSSLLRDTTPLCIKISRTALHTPGTTAESAVEGVQPLASLALSLRCISSATPHTLTFEMAVELIQTTQKHRQRLQASSSAGLPGVTSDDLRSQTVDLVEPTETHLPRKLVATMTSSARNTSPDDFCGLLD